MSATWYCMLLTHRISFGPQAYERGRLTVGKEHVAGARPPGDEDQMANAPSNLHIAHINLTTHEPKPFHDCHSILG